MECSKTGCEADVRARGLCSKHYQHATKAGTLPPLPPRRTRCEVPDCDRGGPFRLGYCYLHRTRLRVYGRLDKLTMDDRFDAKWAVDLATGCHVWRGARNELGYGTINVGGRWMKAHRFAWERANGPVPDGLVLDHFACDNPSCVNPAHVRPVTTRENVLRSSSPLMQRAHKLTCSHGHEWTKANTYWRPDGRGRQCRACTHERAVRRRRARI